MATDDWYFSPPLRQARAELFAAHEQLRAVGGLDDGHPDVVAATERAMKADEAYFSRFPSNQRSPMTAEDESWAATDARTSEIEGFTAGDPS